MRHLVFVAAAILAGGVIVGCKDSTSSAGRNTAAAAAQDDWKPRGLEGAWLGNGTFIAPAGNQTVKAQLELLSDGTYRFMVIEPRMLMMTVGLEKGDWTTSTQQVNLKPYKDQVSSGTLLKSAPRNFPDKTLTVEESNLAMNLKDDQMDMRFLRNDKAARKLRERGELK